MVKLVELPNGTEISALSEAEAKILYHEIFITQPYSQPPIQIQDGDCIFDVGANIGLYSVFLTQSFQNLKILAFEPIPQTFAVLQANAQSTSHSNIQCFNFGLSQQPSTAQFQCDPGLSFMASMYPQEIRQCVRPDADIYEWSRATLHDSRNSSQISPGLARVLDRLLKWPILRRLGVVGLGGFLWWLNRSAGEAPQQITCQLSTVSEVIRQQEIEHISLMKIDTEGSELDVLLGIEAQDWSKIKQFVIEVHDIDHRVEKITDLFAQQGYQTYVKQEDWHVLKLMNIYAVYAIREAT
jgi:FkbM family methyltransferase